MADEDEAQTNWDDFELEDEIAKFRKKRAKANADMAAIEAELSPPSATPSPTPSPSSSVPQDGRKKVISWPNDGMSQQQAKLYLPPSPTFKISKEKAPWGYFRDVTIGMLSSLVLVEMGNLNVHSPDVLIARVL